VRVIRTDLTRLVWRSAQTILARLPGPGDQAPEFPRTLPRWAGLASKIKSSRQECHMYRRVGDIDPLQNQIRYVATCGICGRAWATNVDNHPHNDEICSKPLRRKVSRSQLVKKISD